MLATPVSIACSRNPSLLCRTRSTTSTAKLSSDNQLPPEKVFEDSELEEDSVVRNFQITATDDKFYTTKHYNLSAIIAVGYKVNSERAVQFRKWVKRVVEELKLWVEASRAAGLAS